MRRFLFLPVCSLFFLTGTLARQCSMFGSVDLTERYGVKNPMGNPKSARGKLPKQWETQQGVVFVAPKIVAIYRVIRNEDPITIPRDASGGGGNFILRVSFLSLATDKATELSSLSLVTSSYGFSRVMPTHDGQFVVQTGQKIRHFSNSFQEINAIILPFSPEATMDASWLFVSPSGHEIYAQRTQAFNGGKTGKTTYRILDADSLQNLVSAQLQQPQNWPEGSDPTNWWQPRVPLGLLNKKEIILTATASLPYIAAEIRTRRSNFKPTRILVYNTTISAEVCSVPTNGAVGPRLYSISSEGTLAVVQQNVLVLYR